MKKINLLKKITLIISILLYIVALTQESYYVNKINSDDWSNSFILLLVGWIGMIMGGGAAICWLANPLIFLSWLLIFRKIKIAIVSSIISFILSFLFLFSENVITSEAPTFSKITDYKMGYWLWLSSISIFSVGTITIFIFEKVTNKKLKPDGADMSL